MRTPDSEGALVYKPPETGFPGKHLDTCFSFGDCPVSHTGRVQQVWAWPTEQCDLMPFLERWITQSQRSLLPQKPSLKCYYGVTSYRSAVHKHYTPNLTWRTTSVTYTSLTDSKKHHLRYQNPALPTVSHHPDWLPLVSWSSATLTASLPALVSPLSLSSQQQWHLLPSCLHWKAPGKVLSLQATRPKPLGLSRSTPRMSHL